MEAPLDNHSAQNYLLGASLGHTIGQSRLKRSLYGVPQVWYILPLVLRAGWAGALCGVRFY